MTGGVSEVIKQDFICMQTQGTKSGKLAGILRVSNTNSYVEYYHDEVKLGRDITVGMSKDVTDYVFAFGLPIGPTNGDRSGKTAKI